MTNSILEKINYIIAPFSGALWYHSVLNHEIGPHGLATDDLVEPLRQQGGVESGGHSGLVMVRIGLW